MAIPSPARASLAGCLPIRLTWAPATSRDPGAEQAELAVAEDRHPDAGSERDLLGDPEGRGQRLDEDGLAVV